MTEILENVLAIGTGIVGLAILLMMAALPWLELLPRPPSPSPTASAGRRRPVGASAR